MSVPEEIWEEMIEDFPVGRLGEPEEVARTLCFRCALEAGYIAGVTIPVNGGPHMF